MESSFSDANQKETTASTKLTDVLILMAITCCVGFAILLRIFGSQMYPFFLVVYLWISAYICLIALLLQRNRISGASILKGRLSFVAIILLTVGIRVVFLGLDEYISLDPLWYLDFGRFMVAGAIPYFDFYFPYPPVFGYFIYGISVVAPTVDSFRILATVFDVFIVLTLWYLVKIRVNCEYASVVSIAYALLPMSVIESGWNGHFEPLVNFMMIVAIALLLQKRFRSGGFVLGIAVATKIYPIILYPFFFAYAKTWKDRFELTVSSVISGILTFVPILVLQFINSQGTDPSTNQSMQSGLLDTLFGYLMAPGSISLWLSVVLLVLIVIAVLVLARQIWTSARNVTASLFSNVILILGVVLILLGVIAVLYPLLPASRLVYWRYPIDITIIRGITALSAGFVVIRMALQARRKNLGELSIESLLLLTIGTFLLLLSISRDVFYGWYLLWPIPLFFLLKEKKLTFAVILCLLLVYPSYTHDNFETLGYTENPIWVEEFSHIEDWTINVNLTDTNLISEQVSAGVEMNEPLTARYWFNTSGIQDSEQLQNITISYAKQVDFSIDTTIELVTKIRAEWDPTFGRYADISLTFKGLLQNGTPLNDFVIPPTTLFTNLTSILWRSAVVSDLGVINLTISELTYWIFPKVAVSSGFHVESLYTSSYVILYPIYFIIVPTLIALVFVSLTLVYIELEKIPLW